MSYKQDKTPLLEKNQREETGGSYQKGYSNFEINSSEIKDSSSDPNRRSIFVILVVVIFGVAAAFYYFYSANTTTANDVHVVKFSNLLWTAKTSSSLVGPGPNYFSYENVNVNASGYLTMKITQQSKDKWTAAELISQDSFGYGSYVFVTCSPVDRYDRNIVVGMFTWDDTSYATQVNDEIDIEFSRWGTSRDVALQYSVQPTHNEAFTERTNTPPQAIEFDKFGCSTQMFTWTPTEIRFEGHKGDSTSKKSLTHQWVFTNGSQPRAASEFTRAIRIPEPTVNTKVHLNFWLCDPNGDGFPEPPTNNLNAQVVFKRFQFIPLK